MLLQCLIHPRQGFLDRAAERPDLRSSLVAMLVWRTPVLMLGWLLSLQAYRQFVMDLSHGGGWMGELMQLLPEVRAEPELVKALVETLPAAPSLAKAFPWILVLAPLGVLSLWLHDVVWDHACLWLLGGLGEGKKLRLTAIAEAESLKVGTVGALLALLGYLPGAGCILGIPLFAVGAYFWILRGFALAAWQGCPPWKGVVATLLHVVFAVFLLGGTLLLAWLMAAIQVT